MENVIVFNYVIVLFSIVILLGFFIYNVNSYYSENDDLNLIIDNSEKICVKINYNGQIINYNNKFLNISNNPKNPSFINVGLIKAVDFKDTKPFIKFIDELEESSTATVRLDVVNSEGKNVNVSFVGSTKKNLFGVVNQYILVGTDISGNESVVNELNLIKDKNKKLHAELAYSEEELQRNFEQIKYKQNEVNVWFEKHRLFMHSVNVGILEYDFYTRQFFMSKEFQLLFTKNTVLDLTRYNYNELLEVFTRSITEDSYYNLLEQTYKAINFKIESFNFDLEFKGEKENRIVSVKCDLFLDKDQSLFYFILSTL